MIVYIGLGSNLAHRFNNLKTAVIEIKNQGYEILKMSSIYETPALLPVQFKEHWNRPFLNMVIQIKSPLEDLRSLLCSLQQIEKKMGRKGDAKWSPRIIDLDILLSEEKRLNALDLKVPHPQILNRNFVLAPLKELKSDLEIPITKGMDINRALAPILKNKKSVSALDAFRGLVQPIPTWMWIFNVTPDSFSDGGQINLNNFSSFLEQISSCFGISVVDLGAESTRPTATPVSAKQEWRRLKPYIDLFFDFFKSSVFRPKISLDTRHVETAKAGIACGVDMINDVSGLSNNKMLDVLKESSIEYVLMHNRGVPADPSKTLPLDKDPVEEIKKWLRKKIDILQRNNICLSRIIFDPGIGFGKTADQSLEILKRIREFYSFPLRLMIGHSRKSFMKSFSVSEAGERDIETIGLSAHLVMRGVDILRVHNAPLHVRSWRGFLSIS